jgi:hypothetical protein
MPWIRGKDTEKEPERETKRGDVMECFDCGKSIREGVVMAMNHNSPPLKVRKKIVCLKCLKNKLVQDDLRG